MPKEKSAKRATKRVEKKKKDPNAPKRGLSAYMFFANANRDIVREENPGITFGQVGKVLGERWKALNDKQRIPYEKKAQDDKLRYETEKAAYNVSAEKPVGVRKRAARGTDRNAAQADAEEEESS